MQFRGIKLVGLIVAAGATGCDCDPVDFPDAPLPDAKTFGNVSLAWTVTDLAHNAIECDLVGAKTVSLQLRNQATAGGAPESFSCGGSPSVSRAVETGTYNVTIELRGDDGTLVKVQDQTGVVIGAGRTTMLNPVEFAVDPRGNLALTIAAPGPSNCKTPQGAGITGMTITLKDASGSCAAVKLLRMRGSTVLPPYTVNCGSPQNAGCIENDETLTTEVPLASGAYKIRISGQVGGGPEVFCNSELLPVPAQRKVLTRRLNLTTECPPPAP